MAKGKKKQKEKKSSLTMVHGDKNPQGQYRDVGHAPQGIRQHRPEGLMS